MYNKYFISEYQPHNKFKNSISNAKTLKNENRQNSNSHLYSQISHSLSLSISQIIWVMENIGFHLLDSNVYMQFHPLLKAMESSNSIFNYMGLLTPHSLIHSLIHPSKIQYQH